MSRIVWLLLVSVLACLSGFVVAADKEPAAQVAAASSLRTLWPALVKHYVADTGQNEPRVSFASSGLLSTQISNGAPFDLFLSADLANISRLPAQRLAEPARIYAQGSLSLAALTGSTLASDLSLNSLKKLLAHSGSETSIRLAIPNPVHAPYGKAAQEALVAADLWPLAQGHLLAAENASQALQFLLSGATDVAVIPQTLLSTQTNRLISKSLPEDSYSLVEHYIAILEPASTHAMNFAQWILSYKAHAVLRMSGLQTSTQ